jgi:hypothetical protein
VVLSQGTHLISWPVIYFNSNKKHKGYTRIPKWYIDLSSNVTIAAQSGLLQDRFMTCPPTISIAKTLTPCTPVIGYKKNWVVTLNNNGHPLFGKQLQLQPVNSTCTIVHWMSDCLNNPGDLITLRLCHSYALNFFIYQEIGCDKFSCLLLFGLSSSIDGAAYSKNFYHGIYFSNCGYNVMG